MLKKILTLIGLAKAPAPIRSYLAVSSFFGAVPAIAYVAWKNRAQIQSFVHRLREKAQPKQLAASTA